MENGFFVNSGSEAEGEQRHIPDQITVFPATQQPHT